MADDALIGAVSSDELRHFKARHPAFADALTRLQSKLEEAFAREMRPQPDKPADQQLLVFFLAHQAAEEFFDIVLLAVHGQGLGALKLLRPLYERVVTAVYLMEHPEDVQVFNEYADVHARKVINHARDAGVDLTAWVSAERMADVEAAYQKVRARFRETLCAKCGTTRDQGSWTKKSLKALADDIGLAKLYGGASFWPTMLLHTTRVGLEARLDSSANGLVFQHGPRRDDADRALGYAHALIVQLTVACNRFFGWSLDTGPVERDAETCWGGVGEEKPG